LDLRAAYTQRGLSAIELVEVQAALNLAAI